MLRCIIVASILLACACAQEPLEVQTAQADCLNNKGAWLVCTTQAGDTLERCITTVEEAQACFAPVYPEGTRAPIDQ